MSVSVLMYHHILPKSSFITSSVSEFEEQMAYLASAGYKTLSAQEFMAYKKGELKVSKKSVLITFDDGWRDNFYYAYAILKRYNLRATIFLVTGWIDKASENKSEFIPSTHSECKKLAPINPSAVILNWDEVEKMKDVFDFHSHTHGHSDGYFGHSDFASDLAKCRQSIKERLGFDDTQLCWPRGKYDDEKLRIAKSLGYELFYTTKRGINKADGALDDVRRVAVKKGAAWLKKTLFIYQNDILGSLYEKIKK